MSQRNHAEDPNQRPHERRDLHMSRQARERYAVTEGLISLRGTVVIADLSVAQTLAHRMNEARDVRRFPQLAINAGDLYAAGLLHEAMHLLIGAYAESVGGDLFARLADSVAERIGEDDLQSVQRRFVEAFPAAVVARHEVSVDSYLAGSTEGSPNRRIVLEEMLLLRLSNENPALERLSELFDDRELATGSRYLEIVSAFENAFDGAPGFGGFPSLVDLLRAPMRAHPTSLSGQLAFVREHWKTLLGDRFGALLERMLTSLDVLREENRPGFAGPGPSRVPDAAALRGVGAVEYERFSNDLSWMPQVVLLAKSTYVWLDQLSSRYQREVSRLDTIPDEELDAIAAAGFTGLWLIGLWERSEASRRIKHLRGQPDAVASAYALYDYRIAHDLGGEDAYANLRDRAWARGVRLASDMVPNHVGIDGRWVIEHPDRFLQLDRPPYPGYSFNGPDLSSDERVGVFIEDHYYDNRDAAVVFKRLDRHTGESRYIYHGNDGTSMPWNDTAQIDYLNPEAREAVIQTILEVARRFPIIRFDAAMTLAKQHVQRLWYPTPGAGGAIPSRAQFGAMSTAEFERRMGTEFWREVVDRVSEEVPETLLLAEAFWMMEGYFVRTLGMHRVYNSAFMHMLKEERNEEYRQLIKNVLEFDPQILKRYVNFMNNPDEETAVAQFGKEGKYFGVAIVMSTLPGLPMFGHGQIEGLTEKYGMEYRRAKLDERPDTTLVERHRRELFGLLHRREQFAEVDGFLLYDLVTSEGYVNEDVYAFSNRVGDRVSLVLFHNRYASARGWIRRSSPYLDKQLGELRQRDLFDGFALEGGHDRFVILHEHVSARDTLMRSERVRHEGLLVDLDAYGYRVYLDIREVVDHDGLLSQLEAELAGATVPSIDDALEDLRLRPLHEALAALLGVLSEITEPPVEPAGGSVAASPRTSAVESSEPVSSPTLVELRNAFTLQLDRALGRVSPTPVQEHPTPSDREEVAAESSEDDLVVGETSQRAFGESPAGDPDRAEIAGTGASAPSLAAARLLHDFDLTPSEVDRLRFAPFFERRWQGHADDPTAESELIGVLLAVLQRPAAIETPEQILVHLGESPLPANVLGRALAVNEFQGRTWFVAERFERFIRVLAQLLAEDAATEETLLERLSSLGERADYRFDTLVAPVETEPDPPAANDADGVGTSD